MTDERPPAPRMTRPANANRPPEIRARKLKPQASPESRFIGYLVLGFGVLAVAAVAILYFSGGDDAPKSDKTQQVQNQPTPAAAKSETKRNVGEIARDLASGFLPSPQATAPQPEPRKDLYFKRQPDISMEDIEGSWQSSIGKYAAALQMSKGVYQLILADPNDYGFRLYSSGTYTKTEDMMVLTPRRDWAKPVPERGERIEYRDITTSPFPVIAAIKNGNMLWQSPPPNETRVLVPNSFVLVGPGDPQYVVWQRMKR